jgi:hypothetical protein
MAITTLQVPGVANPPGSTEEPPSSPERLNHVRAPGAALIRNCLCLRPHPCPDHGGWNRGAVRRPQPVEPCTCHTPLGCYRHGPEPRQRAVPCQQCARKTLNVDAVCDTCREVRP